MSIENTVLIAAHEASGSVVATDTLEDRFRAAAKVTYRHWLVTDEDGQFRAAVAAVMLTASEDEKERLGDELLALRDLSALMNGLPIDIERMKQVENPVGLRKLWMEIAATIPCLSKIGPLDRPAQ